MTRPPTDATWDGVPPATVRVLLECPTESSPSVIAEMVERRGYAVRVCEGPDRRHPCAMVDHGACQLVDGADVVVNLFRGTEPGSTEVLPALANLRRPPALVTEMGRPEVRRRDAAGAWDFPRERVVVAESPVTSESLFEAIGTALRRRDLPVPMWGDGFC